MQLVSIILVTILSLVTAVPANSPVINEHIFNADIPQNEKIAKIKELLETSDISTRNSLLENIIQSVIDTLRNLMSNGSDTIPVLDPFQLDELNLSGDLVNLPNSHVTLKDINVANLATFEIDHLRVSTVSIILQRYRIELNARLPVLDAQVGNYDLSIRVFGGHIFGNGQTKVRIVNPRIYANVVVGMRLSLDGIFATIRECNLRINLDAFESEISGFLENEVASEFISSFLNSLVPEFLEFFEEDITNILSTNVMQVANTILNDLNLITLLP